ncbi:MAG: dienelactone hydrolase family protein [Ramlibacter sp.]
MDLQAFSCTEVRVASGGLHLAGDLVVPPDPQGIVLFAHGSGSGRHSSRNRCVARSLQQAGLATLLLDLLMPNEDTVDRRTRHLRLDIPLLSRRLEDATAWVALQPVLQGLPVGYFGASAGSAAALIVAAHLGRRIGAVVSCGGRPDLVGPAVLAAVSAPTLLIVGGEDASVVLLDPLADDRLQVVSELALVAGATHRCEEPGALQDVSRLATDWFARHLARETQAA